MLLDPSVTWVKAPPFYESYSIGRETEKERERDRHRERERERVCVCACARVCVVNNG